MHFLKLSGLVLALTLMGCSGVGTDRLVDSRQPAPLAIPDTGYADGPASRGGTGRFYMGREIARIMGHEGAAWLERPDRAETEMPDAVVDSLDLASDDHVADIGAGTGYFTTRLARRVRQGVVYAVDVQPEMLDMLERRLDREGIRNVELVLGAPDDPNLSAGSVDLVLIVDAYHEFGYPREMLEAIHHALVPGGRLVLVEYRAEDPDLPIHHLHRMSVDQAERELAASGFRLQTVKDFLPHQHFMVFERE